MLKATRFMRKPFFITGYLVTEGNMDELAKWCQGVVVRDDGPKPFIRVPVERATSGRQTKAFAGTWITASKRRGEKSFKVYQEEWLDTDFEALPDDDIEIPAPNPPRTPSPINMPHFRSAGGQLT